MIGDFKYIDNKSFSDKGSISRNPSDVILLQSEKAVAKIRKTFSKIPYSFNFYFVDCPIALTIYKPLFYKLPLLITNIDTAIDEIPILKEHLTDTSNFINIVYRINNPENSENYVPFTSWILMHRMLHILQIPGFLKIDDSFLELNRAHDILTEINSRMDDICVMITRKTSSKLIYLVRRKKLLKTVGDELIRKIFTMRSARLGYLCYDSADCLPELFAQYVITGKITFNKFPSMIRKVKFSETDRNYFDDTFNNLSLVLEPLFQLILELSKGKVFIL